MSTRTGSNELDSRTAHPDDHAPGPQEQSLLLRIAHTYRRGGVWVGHRVIETRDWARQQRPRMLAQAATIGIIGLLLAYAALRLVVALVSALWTWMSGGETTPAPPPPPTNSGDGPPRWMAELPQQPLWTGLADNLVGWIQHQAVLAGIPAVVLLITWAVAGALLLLAAWFVRESVQQVAWWAWLATSCWLIWLHTPGHSPIPAAIVATVGVVVTTVPLAGMLIALAGGTLGVLIIAS